MKRIRFTISELAAADILEQAEWYEAKAGASLAQRWEKAITSALVRVARNPESGSRCSFSAQELQGVRRTTISGFPKPDILSRLATGNADTSGVAWGTRTGTVALTRAHAFRTHLFQ